MHDNDYRMTNNVQSLNTNGKWEAYKKDNLIDYIFNKTITQNRGESLTKLLKSIHVNNETNEQRTRK